MARDFTDTWFFFGDSVTLGVNDNAVVGGWVSRLAMKGAARGLYDLPPATFYNLGCRRHKIAQLGERLEAEYTARLMPGIRARLALCAGTVDLLQGADPGELAERLEPLLGLARSLAPTLFICPPPLASEDARHRGAVYAALASDLCGRMGVPCVDLTAELLAEGFVETLADGIHPDPAGNELLAALLMERPEIITFLTPEDCR